MVPSIGIGPTSELNDQCFMYFWLHNRRSTSLINGLKTTGDVPDARGIHLELQSKIRSFHLVTLVERINPVKDHCTRNCIDRSFGPTFNHLFSIKYMNYELSNV